MPVGALMGVIDQVMDQILVNPPNMMLEEVGDFNTLFDPLDITNR